MATPRPSWTGWVCARSRTAARLLLHVDKVLAAWPGKVEEYRAGKSGLLGFFVGQVVRESGGSADPKVVKAILEERLT